MFITALNGISAIKILAILYLNYKIAKSFPRKYVPAATWSFGIGILFANEFCGGYPLARTIAYWTSSDKSSQQSALVQWAEYLDGLGGLIPRWEVLFNITILRMISFNMDYYWSLDSPTASPIEVSLTIPAITYTTDVQRRNNSIRQHFRSVTGSKYLLNRLLSTAATMSPTSSIHLCILQAPSSHLTTIYPSKNTPLSRLLHPAQYYMEFASS